MVVRIACLLTLLLGVGSCCSDSVVKTQEFDEETLKWFPKNTDAIHFKSSRGLNESYKLRLLENIGNSGFVNHKKCSWTGDRSSFNYLPALYGKTFQGGISVGNGDRTFNFTMNNRWFSLDLLNKENINVTNVPTNESYISDISHLDSLVLSDTTLFDLLLVKDPMLDNNSASDLILKVFILKHIGIVRYDYVDGTIWNRVLN